VQAPEHYARFEADIVTSLFVDSTGMEIAGRITDRDPVRLNALRQGARRPLVTAYHFAYIDSAGSVSVVLSPPSPSAASGSNQTTFLKWEKLAQIRLTAGATLPEITMKNGTVMAAEIPSGVEDGVGQPSQGRTASRAGAQAPMRADQLRALTSRFLRPTSVSPRERRDDEIRDSLRLAKGHFRRWERANGSLEFAARQEIQRPRRPGQPLQRITIDVRNPIVAGSATRLAGER